MIRACWAAFVLFAVLVAASVPLPGRPDGTAIPGEAGTVVETPALCATVPDCHVGPTNTLNTIGSLAISGAPAEYEPGRQYDLGLSIAGNFFTRAYGFQLAAFFQDARTQAGSLQPLTPGTTAFDFEGFQLLTHRDPLDTGEISFRWTAPAAATGPVVLRVASNAANANSSPSGDHIRTLDLVLEPAAIEPELEVFYFPQIGAGSQAGITFSTELIFVNAGVQSPLEVVFRDGAGQPFIADVQVGETLLEDRSSVSTQLGAGHAIKLGITSRGNIQAGYAQIRAAAGVGGTAVFSQRDAGGRVLYEAGVPASGLLTEFSLAAQLEAGVSDTGLALVNPPELGVAGSGPAAQVTLRLYDDEFQLLDQQPLSLASGQHLPRFLTQFFPGLAELAGQEIFQGSITVESDFPLSAVTLRQTTVPTLTAFPVIPGRADSP